ncbi:hypothetical protein C8T65DRAFT_806409, partial [Cerioporus squamosus]
MSSDADAAAIVAQYDTIYTQEYLIVAATVIVICDAFITFDREVACFWTAKRTGASLLFFANRWMTLTLCIMNMVVWASFPSDQVCTSVVMAAQAIGSVQYVPGAAFSALRAYVLSRRKLLGLLVCALSLAPVGVNLVPYGYHLSGHAVPPFGCLHSDNTTVALVLRFVIVSRTPLIVADILLIYVTCTKLSSRDTLRGIGQSRRMTMSDILLRSGVIYLCTCRTTRVIISDRLSTTGISTLFGLNVLHLVLSATAIATDNAGSSY